MEEERKEWSILNALGKDYLYICLVNIKTEEISIVKWMGEPAQEEDKHLKLSYREMCCQSIDRYVRAEEQKKIQEAVSLPKVLKELQLHGEYRFYYEAENNGREHRYEMKFASLEEKECILMGFRTVDNTMLSEMAENDKQNKETIKKNVEDLRRERTFLDVLARDYTSVYYFDLQKDTLEILKMSAASNTASMFGVELRKKLDYSKEMEIYCETYVEKDEKEEFLNAMSLENISEKLEEADEFVYRYQSNPNLSGHRYFEAQAIRILEEGFENAAILAFRHIDDIIASELKHQKELELALQKERTSNEVLQAISKIYYAIYQIDLEKDIYEEIVKDDAADMITGKSGCASEKMQQICKTFVVPEYQDRIGKFFDLQTLAQRLDKDGTLAEEYLTPDGNWHTARFIENHRNAEGKVTQVLYVTRLISDEKRREKNWITIAEEANKANQSKTEFLRRMSHDIRTPINGIMGMIELADRHKDDVEKLYEYKAKVLGAMEYLLSLVNNVLDIGKLETGDVTLENRAFDLIPLLMKQLPIIEMQANQNDIKFRGGKEMSMIRHRFLIGSPVHLNRILMNLANNAVKYNRKGGTVTVYCTEISSDENTAVYQFICSDDGIGMSEEFQKYAFDPFTQEGKEALTTYNGLGLGLSIVKKIVNQMHGTIELKSKEGAGTTFIITIPFEIDKVAQQQKESGKVLHKVDVTGKKALLVEDNELNQEITKMYLEDEGFVVSIVQNGKEAVDAFDKNPPGTYDYIFMDIMMPQMDGLEATRRIRAMDRPDAKTIPILAMTANAFQDDIRQSIEAGMNAHLMKPLEREKLIEALAKCKND